MDNVVSIFTGILLIGLLAYLARRVRRHLRGAGRARTHTEREALSEAEFLTRGRLPF